jgi:hypothetical protein
MVKPDIRETIRALDPVAVFGDAFGHNAMDHQVEYLRATGSLVAVKSRQAGFSTAAAALCLHRALFWPGSTSAIVSPTQRQSSEVAMRARIGVNGLGVRLRQDSATVLRFANDSRILSLPGSPRAVRGWSVDGVLVLDEAAFMDDELAAVARATTATGGRLVVQSTPAGEFGFFFNLVQDTPAGWHRMKVTADDVPTISAAFLEQERASLVEDVFLREFYCAFGKAGRGMFTLDQVAAMRSDERPYAPFAALEDNYR